MRTHEFDFFISYASEDSEFVDQIVGFLIGAGIRIWQDKLVLLPGDSLRKSIDDGIQRSRYVVAVFSENYFNKPWPNREFDGLTMLELSEDRNILIPIWYNISKSRVIRFSPPLANKVAIVDSNAEVISSKLMHLFSKSGGITDSLDEKTRERGFYYRSHDFSIKIEENNRIWLVDWSAVIQSEIRLLKSIDITFRIDGLIRSSLSDSVLEPDISLADGPSANPWSIKKIFSFDKAIEEGQRKKITYRRSFEKSPPVPTEDYFHSKGAIRCDSLGINLSFAEPPRWISYRVTDRGENYIISEENLPHLGSLSLSKTVVLPDKAFSYGYYWGY
jgi:hypothetical protein